MHVYRRSLVVVSHIAMDDGSILVWWWYQYQLSALSLDHPPSSTFHSPIGEIRNLLFFLFLLSCSFYFRFVGRHDAHDTSYSGKEPSSRCE